MDAEEVPPRVAPRGTGAGSAPSGPRGRRGDDAARSPGARAAPRASAKPVDGDERAGRAPGRKRRAHVEPRPPRVGRRSAARRGEREAGRRAETDQEGQQGKRGEDAAEHRRFLRRRRAEGPAARPADAIPYGAVVRIRAAVLEEFGAPLAVQEVDLAEPKAGEVLVRLVACGVCHTDLYTASGADPSGYAPTVLGHEGAGVVERVGDGVSSTSRPATTSSRSSRRSAASASTAASPRTNLCLAIREQQNQGYLPDGTTRLSRDGEPIRHFMGTSTFAEYTVMPEIALAKVDRRRRRSTARACSPAGSRPGSARR